jgi:hypothetical protein
MKTKEETLRCTQTNHEISRNGREEGSSHLEVNTEVPAHGLGGCNASQRNTMESEKQQMYKSRREVCAADLTLGGVGRLPRVLHLEPEASAAARQESVRERPNPWRQGRRNTRARDKTGEGDLTMVATGERKPRGVGRRLRRRQGVGKKAAAAGAREIM